MMMMDDDAAKARGNLQSFPESADHEAIRQNFIASRKLLVRSVTWNQQGQPITAPAAAASSPVQPDGDDDESSLLVRSSFDPLSILLPRNYFHLIAVGTQECERSIAQSVVNPWSNKRKWERLCQNVLGLEDYELVKGHSLQASHLVLFVHKAILPLVSNVRSHAVATGFCCNTLGNKGGVAISVTVGNRTSFCFLTAHLSAHQNRADQRAEEFARISREVARALGNNDDGSNKNHGNADCCLSRRETKLLDESSSMSNSTSIHTAELGNDDEYFEDTNWHCKTQERSCLFPLRLPSLLRQRTCCCWQCPNPPRGKHCLNPLIRAFDYVIWGGDLNFRINGTREGVDSLLLENRRDILQENDQLKMLLHVDAAFAGLEEGSITFQPTYKYDKGTDRYDTSAKRRIPAWTDRILYKPSPGRLELLSYSSVPSIRDSDHKPVYASFQTSVNLDGSNAHK